MTQHGHHADHEPWRNLPEGFAEHLTLEAHLNAPVRLSALDLAAAALDTPPTHIVDLGSGIGADAVALADRFPAATVHALDVSTQLLDIVGAAAAEVGVRDRVRTCQADLNGAWGAAIPDGVDLVWAALSLHHVADAAMVLQQVHSSLRPGGVLLLTEMTGHSQFEPEGLERVMAAQPQQAHASIDWPALLAAAGLVVVESQPLEFTASGSSTEEAAYLQNQLQTRRGRLGDRLGHEDRASLDAVIAALGRGEADVSFRSGRTVWVARRPEVATRR